jgi:mitogen-activated protein kinase organizer 1
MQHAQAPPLVPGSLPTRCARVLRGHTAPLQVARFCSSGRYCVTAGQDRVVSLWNPFRDSPEEDGDGPGAPPSSSSSSTGALLLTQLRGHGYDVVDASLSVDGSRLVSCGGDKCAFVFDVPTGRVLRKQFGHEGNRLHSVSLSGPGESVLVTAGDDKTVRCWDLRAAPRGAGPGGPAAIQTLGGFKDTVTRVLCGGAAAPSLPPPQGAGGQGGGGGGGGGRGGGGGGLPPFPPPSNGPADITACSLDGQVRRFDLRTGRCVADDVGSPVGAMAASHDGLCLLLALPALPATAPNAATPATAGPSAPPPASGLLALVERDTGTVLARYSGHRNADYRLQPTLTSDDAHVVCGSEDGSVVFWDLVEGTVAHTIPAAHKRVVSSVDVHPSPLRQAMLTASFDGTARLWVGARDAGGEG